MERDQKTLKEWEIKYKKLESLYEREKKKFDADRTRIKAETAALKKRTDDALAELSNICWPICVGKICIFRCITVNFSGGIFVFFISYNIP